VDPQRDICRVLVVATQRGARVSHVAETHLENQTWVLMAGRTPAWRPLRCEITGGRARWPAASGTREQQAGLFGPAVVVVDGGDRRPLVSAGLEIYLL